jgi:predicted RecB family nuclease
MRRERVDQTPFKLHQFRGVDLSYTDKLSEVGIRSTDDLLSEARTKPQRTALADKALIPTEALDEMVRLSDLARIGGIKSIRARLYYDAGIRSVADLAKWDPIELVSVLRRFVSETGFEGMAPLPGEARHAVETAKALRPLIEW